MGLQKYHGIIPAFYAVYDQEGKISKEGVKELARHLVDKGVHGLYVGGSSGECVYQTVEERKAVLEAVMEEVGDETLIIAHIAAASSRDSVELAKHAEKLGVDALAAIPPIYYHLPERAIEDYWNAMIESTKLDFIIYNIPQLTNYQLSLELYQRMLKNPQVIGVKNSSMPVQDILKFKHYANREVVIFNGPDEQYIAGRMMGADGGIGGTYAVMPEMFLMAEEAIQSKNMDLAQEIQVSIEKIIHEIVQVDANLYAVIKEIYKLNGMDLGGVREPLHNVKKEDLSAVEKIDHLIKTEIKKFQSR